MLLRLHIQNYAIIDELEIDFSPGLNIITGETGAGKSIIAGALGLILGDRADTSVLVNKEKKCMVEGNFEAGRKLNIKKFLQENNLDAEHEILIRREINNQGKSRAFINDTPVSLAQLNQLSSLLVDLHQQFDTLALGESDFQREVLDALASQAPLLEEYRHVFYQWQTSKKELEELKNQKQQFEREKDFFQFQFDELEEAGFRENELEDCDAELKRLSNSEEIKSALSTVYETLNEGEKPVVQQLKNLLNQLQAFTEFHPGLPELLQRLQSVQIELKDIAEETGRINDQVGYDPLRIEQISERIAIGYRLLKKHGVKTTSELLSVRSGLADKLQAVMDLDETIRHKENETDKLAGVISGLAQKISAGRKIQAKPLEDKVNKLLGQVGMPNARLQVEIRQTETWQSYGMDSVDFLFDANKSGQPLPLRKVASGGELSRLMLCIKSLVAQSIDLPTLIFDEIDTGISGEAARQVGIIMKQLAENRQLISITHQPQIAGKADAHFYVYKEMEKGSVKTGIRLLSTEERITAIAKMLSGEKPTAAAIENAREMVAD